jgi:metal-sulfur cluster biosynthetic enzyme
MDRDQLQKDVIKRLQSVIDPETGVDVVRMRLIQDITIDDEGNIEYVFKPSSPLCPIAVPLALSIMRAISEVPGIMRQKIEVKEYSQAEALTELLKNLFKI